MSVDLDEIGHYHAIHGLAAADGHLVYDLALERIGAFGRERGVPITLFAIGVDLERAAGAASIRRLVDSGAVVENHSLSHQYDLTRLSHEEMLAEVRGGADLIEQVTGRRPGGFRAPGYTVNDALFDVLEEAGVEYDSSVFPCPAYWGAKAVVLGTMRARGRSSASILDTPRVMTAPRRPYRPGHPWFTRGRRAVVELPIQVTPWARLPFIGTSIMLLPPTAARWLAKTLAGEDFVNIELHGIDFLDATDGLEALVPHQPELRRPLPDRLGSLNAALEQIRRSGAQLVTLDEAARHLIPAL